MSSFMDAVSSQFVQVRKQLEDLEKEIAGRRIIIEKHNKKRTERSDIFKELKKLIPKYLNGNVDYRRIEKVLSKAYQNIIECMNDNIEYKELEEWYSHEKEMWRVLHQYLKDKNERWIKETMEPLEEILEREKKVLSRLLKWVKQYNPVPKTMKTLSSIKV